MLSAMYDSASNYVRHATVRLSPEPGNTRRLEATVPSPSSSLSLRIAVYGSNHGGRGLKQNHIGHCQLQLTMARTVENPPWIPKVLADCTSDKVKVCHGRTRVTAGRCRTSRFNPGYPEQRGSMHAFAPTRDG